MSDTARGFSAFFVMLARRTFRPNVLETDPSTVKSRRDPTRDSSCQRKEIRRKEILGMETAHFEDFAFHFGTLFSFLVFIRT